MGSGKISMLEMKKTAGIFLLASLISLVSAKADTDNWIRFGDIPQETPMYTAWGVDYRIQGVVDAANAASNFAYQAYVNTSNVFATVTNVARSAEIAQSNAVIAVNAASAAIFEARRAWDLAMWCSNAIEQIEQQGVYAKKHVALFILPLNPHTSSGAGLYSGFELKATTNNFSHAVSGSDIDSGRMVFWCASICINDDLTGYPHDYPEKSWDNMWVYSCDTGVVDTRAWTKWGELLDSGNGVVSTRQVNNRFPRYVAVLVCKEMLHRVGHEQDNGWLNSENDELLWSFARVSNGELEKDSSGYPIWTVCQPVKWLKRVPTWAYGQVN